MKKQIVTIIVLVALAALVAVGFYFLANASVSGAEGQTEVTEVEELIAMDLSVSYPQSPRAVVNLYCRMLTAFYNEEYDEEQMQGLLDQMYFLYDEDLQAINPIDTYYITMEAELLSHGSDGWHISNYAIPDTDEVTYQTVAGREMALLTVSFYIKEGNSFVKSYQDFVLRKDANKNWKIYGYSLHN